MKPTVSSINRRMLLATLTVLPALPAGLSTTTRAQDAANTLGSWNNGGAKQAIIDFVRTTTDHSSGKFVPASERTAVFDQDGTRRFLLLDRVSPGLERLFPPSD